MSAYEIYAFLLCLIVLVLLTAVLGALLFYIARLTLRLIRSGAEDANIKKRIRGDQERVAHSRKVRDGALVDFLRFILPCLRLCNLSQSFGKQLFGQDPVYARGKKCVDGDQARKEYVFNEKQS